MSLDNHYTLKVKSIPISLNNPTVDALHSRHEQSSVPLDQVRAYAEDLQSFRNRAGRKPLRDSGDAGSRS
jgi:hypothetical protein